MTWHRTDHLSLQRNKVPSWNYSRISYTWQNIHTKRKKNGNLVQSPLSSMSKMAGQLINPPVSMQGLVWLLYLQQKLFVLLFSSPNCFSRRISLTVFCLSSYIFWLIRSLADPTAAFIVCSPFQFVVSHLCISDYRFFQIRYAALLKHGTGHAVECLFRLALSSHIYSFAFRDTNLDTLTPFAPKRVMWQRVFRGGASEFKVRNLI